MRKLLSTVGILSCALMGSLGQCVTVDANEQIVTTGGIIDISIPYKIDIQRDQYGNILNDIDIEIINNSVEYEMQLNSIQVKPLNGMEIVEEGFKFSEAPVDVKKMSVRIDYHDFYDEETFMMEQMIFGPEQSMIFAMDFEGPLYPGGAESEGMFEIVYDISSLAVSYETVSGDSLAACIAEYKGEIHSIQFVDDIHSMAGSEMHWNISKETWGAAYAWVEGGVLYIGGDGNPVVLNANFDNAFSGMQDVSTIDIVNVDLSKVVSMNNSFKDCISLENIMFDGDAQFYNLESLVSTFYGCESLTSVDFRGWQIPKLKDMSYMFAYCTNLTHCNLDGWDVRNLEKLNCTWMHCTNIEDIGFSGWETSSLTNVFYAFSYTTRLADVDVWDWDMSKATNVVGMFRYATGMEYVNMSNWDMSSVTSTIDMLQGCRNLKIIKIGKQDWNNVVDMRAMFEVRSPYLTELDLSQVVCENVIDVSYAFALGVHLYSENPTEIEVIHLDLSGFNFSNVQEYVSGSSIYRDLSFSTMLDRSVGSVTLSQQADLDRIKVFFPSMELILK